MKPNSARFPSGVVFKEIVGGALGTRSGGVCLGAPSTGRGLFVLASLAKRYSTKLNQFDGGHPTKM